MATTRCAVPLHEGRDRSIQEEHANPMTRGAQIAQDTHHVGLLTSVAHHEAQLLMRIGRLTGKVDHLLDEGRRQIVYDEPAKVFEIVGCLGTPRTRQSGDHENVGHNERLPMPEGGCGVFAKA